MGGVGYAYGKGQARSYQSTATLYVQQASQTANGLSGSTNPYTSAQLAQTFSQMITDPTIAARANQILAKQHPGEAIQGVSSSQRAAQTGNQTFDVVATAAGPRSAARRDQRRRRGLADAV